MAVSRKCVRLCVLLISIWMFMYVSLSSFSPSGIRKPEVVFSRVITRERQTLKDVTNFFPRAVSKDSTKIDVDALVNRLKNRRERIIRSMRSKENIRREIEYIIQNLTDSFDTKDIEHETSTSDDGESSKAENTIRTIAEKSQNKTNKGHTIEEELRPPTERILQSNITSVKSNKLLNTSYNNPNSYYNFSKEVITPLNATFVINSNHLCKEFTPELILLVPSSASNINARNAIRKSYAQLSRDKVSNLLGVQVKYVIRTIFFVGRTSDKDLSDIIKENEIHKDIVLIDFLDSYQQLTRKVLYGFRWVHTYCPKTTYVMKVDDDVFVNTAILSKRLFEQPMRINGSVYGHIYSGNRAVARTGKWAVPYDAFPLPSYPDYMSGTSYVISADIIPNILYIAQRLPYLSIEDAFITGIIANRLIGAQLTNWVDNSYWNYFKPNPCSFMKQILSMTNADPFILNDIWKTLISNGTLPDGRLCPN